MNLSFQETPKDPVYEEVMGMARDLTVPEDILAAARDHHEGSKSLSPHSEAWREWGERAESDLRYAIALNELQGEFDWNTRMRWAEDQRAKQFKEDKGDLA